MNQRRLIKQVTNCEFQLASRNKQISCGFPSFICFSRASGGVNGTSPPKVGPENHSETSLDTSTSNSGKESVVCDTVDDSEKKIFLKSSLKKPLADCSVLSVQAVDTNDSLRELPSGMAGFTKKGKLQWTDACGKELVEIKEFEPRYDSTSMQRKISI